jgi:poly(3-hydroxybutyrate) depolymerase
MNRTPEPPPAPPPTADASEAAEAAESGPIARYFLRGGDRANVSKNLAAAVEAVSATDGYERSRLPEILHGAGLFPEMRAGQHELVVPVGHESGRRVLVHLPARYDPGRAWPLLVAYHSGGGSADGMLSSAVRMLGERAEGFVVAAPHHYRQTGLDHPRPVSSEHAEILRTIKERVNVDSDRVYVTGFSTGGYTAWFLATLQPDLWAGAIPMAATFSVPMDERGLAELFLPNLRHLPVLSVWGGRDTLNVPGLNGRRTRDTMASLNRRLGPMLRSEGLDNVIHHEVPKAGHGGYSPPAGPMARALESERENAPEQILHRFRYIHQGHAYWIEGHEWSGDLWSDKWPPRGRAFEELLGEIRAEAGRGPEGTMLELMTRHLGDLTVWLDDALVADWSKPVTVIHDGRQVFQGAVEPDLAVALSQARRTRDLDRIRWAGIRIDTRTGKARVVTADDDFPPVLREVLGR